MSNKEIKEALETLGSVKMKPEPKPKTYPREWEKVNKHTYRLKVPFGWYVQTHDFMGGPFFTGWINDPDHKWILEDAD